MLLDIRKIEHQKQLGKNLCVPACLAMITGIDQQQITKELFNDGFKSPFSSKAAMRFLCRKSIHMESVKGTSDCGLMGEKIYLLSCPSSVAPKMAHMIVALTFPDGVKILDPSEDFESEKNYHGEDFTNGNIPIFAYYLLNDCNKGK